MAGDRVSWFGEGSPPKMPGAQLIECAGSVLHAGRIAAEEFLDAPEAGEEALRAAARERGLSLLRQGVTGIVRLHGGLAVIERSLDAVARGFRDAGLRVVVGFAAQAPGGDLDFGERGLRESLRFILANQDPLVRGVFGLGVADQVPEPLRAAAETEAEALGTVVLAAGSLKSDFPVPRFFSERFGRRFDCLEEGAAGDAVALAAAGSWLAVAGGRVVFREGQPVPARSQSAKGPV